MARRAIQRVVGNMHRDTARVRAVVVRDLAAIPAGIIACRAGENVGQPVF